MSGAGQVEIALVDRTNLYLRCEIVGVGKHELGEAFIFFKVARNKNQFWAEFLGFGGWHSSPHTACAGLITGRGDHSSLGSTHRDGLSTESGIRSLFHRGVKRVGIQMEDRTNLAHMVRTRQETTPCKTASVVGMGGEGEGGVKRGDG